MDALTDATNRFPTASSNAADLTELNGTPHGTCKHLLMPNGPFNASCMPIGCDRRAASNRDGGMGRTDLALALRGYAQAVVKCRFAA